VPSGPGAVRPSVRVVEPEPRLRRQGEGTADGLRAVDGHRGVISHQPEGHPGIGAPAQSATTRMSPEPDPMGDTGTDPTCSGPTCRAFASFVSTRVGCCRGLGCCLGAGVSAAVRRGDWAGGPHRPWRSVRCTTSTSLPAEGGHGPVRAQLPDSHRPGCLGAPGSPAPCNCRSRPWRHLRRCRGGACPSFDYSGRSALRIPGSRRRLRCAPAGSPTMRGVRRTVSSDAVPREPPGLCRPAPRGPRGWLPSGNAGRPSAPPPRSRLRVVRERRPAPSVRQRSEP